MKKRIIVALFALLGIGSTIAICNAQLYAATTPSYQSGGSISGRVNIAPANMNGTKANIGFQKGDRLTTGLGIGWMLMDYQTYTDYNCSVNASAKTISCPSGNPQIQSWMAMTTKAFDTVPIGLSQSDFSSGIATGSMQAEYAKTTLATSIDTFNTRLKANSSDQSLLTYRNWTNAKELVDLKGSGNANNLMVEVILNSMGASKETEKSAFAPSYFVRYTNNATNGSYLNEKPYVSKDFRFIADYWTTYIMSTNTTKFSVMEITANNGGAWTQNSAITPSVKRAVRPSANLDTNNIVFSVSQGNSNTIATVSEPAIPQNYTDLYAESGRYEEMKPRILDSNYTVTFNDIKNKSGTSITSTMKGSTITLDVTSNNYNNSTISVLLFDAETNAFKYYKPLDTAGESGGYTLDLSDVAVGKYAISVVNEAYQDANTAATYSSLLSDLRTLEVVEPLALTYTSKPTQNLSTFVYGKNVALQDQIGTVAYQNGAGTPTLTISSDPDAPSGHENDYLNFEATTINSTTSSADIQIKNNAPDAYNNYLETGSYYFVIEGKDENGDPDPAAITKVKLGVEKAIPTIAFDDPNKTIRSLASAQTSWDETATSTPANTDVHTQYEVTGGDIGILDIDPDTGTITTTSPPTTGAVTIQATVDDDPATGKDNYESISTTKEIVIVDGVDGILTPDSASSDTITPTFKATDVNVKTGGSIATISGTNGFFDNGTSGTITYTYGLKDEGDSSYFTVDTSTGLIKTKVNLTINSYHITLTVADQWTNKEIPLTINVGQAGAEALKFYDPTNTNTVITTQTANLKDTNVSVFAEVKGSTNTNVVNYAIKAGSPTNILSVHPTTGLLTIQNAGTTIITAKKKGESGQADAYAELTFTITQATQDFIFTDESYNPLPTNADGTYQPYMENGTEKTYQKAGTFQLYTNGSAPGSTITYTLKNSSPTDVIDVDTNGLVTILNANTALQKDKVIVQATSHDPAGNYTDKTIEIPVNIGKATPVISFKEVMNVINGRGSVEPVILDSDLGNQGDGGTTVSDTQYIISVDSSISSSLAWTNDGKTIQYDYSGQKGIDVPLKVTKPGNRNYISAEATGKIYIIGLEESVLEVNTPGTIFYGDTFTIRSLQDDASSINVVYTFHVSDPAYIRSGTQTNNQMTFDAIQASGTTDIEIKVERTADGEYPLSKTIKVRILPKTITIKLDDQKKKTGADLPDFTYQDFDDQLISWNGIKDVIQPADIRITTTATPLSPVGTYPIHLDVSALDATYPNYTFKAEPTTLTVSADKVENTWYHMETEDGEVYQSNQWINQDVFVVSDHVDYQEFSLDKAIWKSTLKEEVEGKHTVTFYMKNTKKEISEAKTETILIDKTPPKILDIAINEGKLSGFAKLYNSLISSNAYKPGINIDIKAQDQNPGDIEISGVASIQYTIIDKTTDTIVDTQTADTTETLRFQMKSPGKYKVCAVAIDHAGNESDEKCKGVEIKKINIDVDGDGEEDFRDTDEDGCPDINIVWKNEDGSWTKLNVDRDNDGIPDYNIDSDGDGIAEINIDTDGDGNPDLNLLDLRKQSSIDSLWKPSFCVKNQKEEYCTMPNLKPTTNIDVDYDGSGKESIPDIDIDTNGDMKPDLNISKKPADGKGYGKPYINIVNLHEWRPEKDYNAKGFAYDSIDKDKKKPQLNIDTDGDGRPDLNLDFEPMDGIPDLNIDTNGDGVPDLNIDGDGDGVADINIDTDEDGKADKNVINIKEWKPNKDCEKEGFLYDTMDTLNYQDSLEDKNVVVTKPGGSFLPNFALKVDKVTDQIDDLVKHDMIAKAKGKEIKEVYDVKLFNDNIQVQPDGKLQIQIPIPEGIVNPRLVVEQSDGTYLHVVPEIKDGYLIYESEYLGKVGVVGEADAVQPPTSSEPEDTGGPIADQERKTSVLGSYTGVSTGDETSVSRVIISLSGSMVLLLFLVTRHKRNARS